MHKKTISEETKSVFENEPVVPRDGKDIVCHARDLRLTVLAARTTEDQQPPAHGTEAPVTDLEGLQLQTMKDPSQDGPN